MNKLPFSLSLSIPVFLAPITAFADLFTVYDYSDARDPQDPAPYNSADAPDNLDDVDTDNYSYIHQVDDLFYFDCPPGWEPEFYPAGGCSYPPTGDRIAGWVQLETYLHSVQRFVIEFAGGLNASRAEVFTAPTCTSETWTRRASVDLAAGQESVELFYRDGHRCVLVGKAYNYGSTVYMRLVDFVFNNTGYGGP